MINMKNFLFMANKNKETQGSKKGPNNKKGRKKKPEPAGLLNNVFFYIFLLVIGYLIFGLIFSDGARQDQRPISEVLNLIRDGRVQDVVVSENNLEILLTDGTQIVSQKEANISFDEILANNNIDRDLIVGEVRIEHPINFGGIFTTLLLFGIPVLLILFIFRQMRSNSGDIFAFGKSRAKLFNKDYPKVTFEDVAGNEEAKVEMKEIVDFLKHPDKYRKLGARIPKGVLLVGPSGVGKTLLAKAIAGEANVPFFSVAGSEFMEMLVGVGSARARDLFKMAKASQPSLIFIDEVDAIGRQRGMGIGGGHDEREQTLNQILIEMDGFDPRTDVIVLAATNRPDMLDPALVRAGRFDRRITIPLPDLSDREQIIKIHMRGKPIDENMKFESIAKKTVGFSGADIENMLNEAAIFAARADRDKITAIDIEEAALKVTMGAQRKTLQTEDERRMIAYHEAGHALVATHVPDMDPVYRVSIVARGGSLGHTSFPPERDRYNETRTRLISILTTMLGGRAAEDVVFNELTIGAADDIDRASKLARKMVTAYGMSSLGPISYNGKEDSPWVAREMHDPLYSQEMAAKIDNEVKSLIDDAFAKARNILTENREILDRIANKLLEKETIEGEEYLQLVSA
jgi:cell division protease FtsH